MKFSFVITYTYIDLHIKQLIKHNKGDLTCCSRNISWLARALNHFPIHAPTSCLGFYLFPTISFYLILHKIKVATCNHSTFLILYLIHAVYCKCITFGDVFFLAPLAVVSIRQIKYIAKCASI